MKKILYSLIAVLAMVMSSCSNDDIEIIDLDEDDDKIRKDYDYVPKKGKSPHKYIATAVEAMVAAIYNNNNLLYIYKYLLHNILLLHFYFHFL